MKASEMIKLLNELVELHGDKTVIFESNRHRFDGNNIVNADKHFIVPLLDKVEI